ncbi:MAG: imidazole glycerol phosphate synthase subunit HisH [Candidatus Hodgkinia cicadicola]
MKIAIIDYGVGNLKSIVRLVELSAISAKTSAEVVITCDPEVVRESDRIILPGVGCFPNCWNKLQNVKGLLSALNYVAIEQSKPVLGICVGMQLMATLSLELRKTPGLNWIPGLVTRLMPSDCVRIPHIGWNVINSSFNHHLFENIPLGQNGYNAYFAHSYHFDVVNNCNLLATTPYGSQITAAVIKGNLVGVQFHPEKSHILGLMFFKNFITWQIVKN